MKRIEFETAKILNKKGWTIFAETVYDILNGDDKSELKHLFKIKGVQDNELVYAPYQEEVIEWLLNEHKIFIQIELEQASGSFSYLIFTRTGLSILYGCATIGGKHIDRNRAIEMAILDALKLINSNNN